MCTLKHSTIYLPVLCTAKFYGLYRRTVFLFFVFYSLEGCIKRFLEGFVTCCWCFCWLGVNASYIIHFSCSVTWNAYAYRWEIVKKVLSHTIMRMYTVHTHVCNLKLLKTRCHIKVLFSTLYPLQKSFYGCSSLISNERDIKRKKTLTWLLIHSFDSFFLRT